MAESAGKPMKSEPGSNLLSAGLPPLQRVTLQIDDTGGAGRASNDENNVGFGDTPTPVDRGAFTRIVQRTL
jgi:hypothetical protein